MFDLRRMAVSMRLGEKQSAKDEEARELIPSPHVAACITRTNLRGLNREFSLDRGFGKRWYQRPW
jgi:hypothetical protein